MLLFVAFDINADIIDVPQKVIDDKDRLSSRFLKWLYLSPDIKRKYTKTIHGHEGLCYRSEAFVEYLNKKVLRNSEEKAFIVKQFVPRENETNLPSVFF